MKFVLLALTALLFSCSDATEAERVLRENGYQNIQTQGYDFFKCGRDDWYATKFQATAPGGTEVTGTVCSGLLFKGSTIRF